MIGAPFRVVLDANVLYPATLRDTLLRAAGAGFFQACWSAQILDEALRNLISSGRITEPQSRRLRAAMERAFPEAMVTGHESLTVAMENDPKDRHVAAAAVKAGAQLIVTANVKDFRKLPEGIDVQSPDHFLCSLFELDPDRMRELVTDQAAALKSPPRSLDEVLTALEKTIPDFVMALRMRAHGQ